MIRHDRKYPTAELSRSHSSAFTDAIARDTYENVDTDNGRDVNRMFYTAPIRRAYSTVFLVTAGEVIFPNPQSILAIQPHHSSPSRHSRHLPPLGVQKDKTDERIQK